MTAHSRWFVAAMWLVASLVATAVAPSVARAQGGAETPATADEVYALAQEHYLARRYTEALPFFQKLADEQQSPNARLYVARCLREIGRLPDAYRQMRRTVKESEARAATEPRFLGTRDAAAKELNQLEAQVARVVLVLPGRPAGLDIEIDGRPVSMSELDEAIVVSPGTIRIAATAPGFELSRHHAEVHAGSEVNVAISLTPRAGAGGRPRPRGGAAVAASKRPSTAATTRDAELSPAEPRASEAPAAETGSGLLAAAAVTGGIGVVGFIVLIAAGLEADRLYDEVNEACAGSPCTTPEHEDDLDSGKTLDIVANVGLGVGIAGVLTGGVLLGIHLAGGDAPDAARVELAPSGAGARVSVVF